MKIKFIISLFIVLFFCVSAEAQIFSTKFNKYTVGQQPYDWTERYTTTDGSIIVRSGNYLEIDSPTASYFYLGSWNLPSNANTEVLAKVWCEDDGNAYQFYIIQRGGGTVEAATYYHFAFLGNYTPASREVKIRRMNSGAGSTLASYTYAWEEDTWYWVRFRVNGVGDTINLKAKIWADGEAEPASWQIDYDHTGDNRIADAGWTGIRSNTSGARVDYISVALSGLTAGSPTVTTGSSTTTVIGSTATVILGGD